MKAPIDLAEVDAEAREDWKMREIREFFRGDFDAHVQYRRSAAEGRVCCLVPDGDRMSAIEVAKAAAALVSPDAIPSAAVRVWSEHAHVREAFGSLPKLVKYMQRHRAALAHPPAPPPAAE